VSVRLNLALASLAVVACTTPKESVPLAASADVAESKVAPPSAVQRGVSVTRLYNESCAKCHGDNAQGGGGGTLSLISRDKFDQKWDKPFFDAIKNGVPNMGMEAFGQTLSDKEIWGLVVHIRELQAKGLADELAVPAAKDGVISTQREKYRVEDVVTEGLRTPWAIDWLPDGRFLVTNRPGAVTLFSKGGERIGDVEGVPQARELGQGGMMEVAVHPDYAKNGWIYLGYAEPGGNGAQTKIVRGKLRFEAGKPQWTAQATIYQAPPEAYTGAGIHFGTRIVFDRKGHVFFAIGERGGMMAAQDPKTSVGKVFRVNEDGSIPTDNPFPGLATWSMGHRNPQGLAFDLEGNLWDTEHGPRGGDEFNRIQKGGNYGWPTHAFSINYNDAPFEQPWPKAGEKITLPELRWIPSIAASGLDTVRGNAFPNWKGDLLAGGLASTVIERIRVKSGKLVEHERILQGMGRVREVTVGPDGLVYVALNQPDKIIRLVPAR
jgi:glucose/arabinose dehydrogenase